MSNMASSRESFQPEVPEELLQFLNETTNKNRDHKALRECLPTLQVQSLADMRIHEQLAGSPITMSWPAKGSDTDSNYDQAETSPFEHEYGDASLTTSPISPRHTPGQLKTKTLSVNSESSSPASPRFCHRISNLDERIFLYGGQPSPHVHSQLDASNYPKHPNPNHPHPNHPDPNVSHENSSDSEVSALKFRIVELEYVNAALEGKVRQYQDEIRLFKKDVKGYKNDGRRFTQQLKEKNMEITALHTKIIQLLNNDTLAADSPQTVMSNPNLFSATKVSPTANHNGTTPYKYRHGGKAASEDFGNLLRKTGRNNNDADPMRWF